MRIDYINITMRYYITLVCIIQIAFCLPQYFEGASGRTSTTASAKAGVSNNNAVSHASGSAHASHGSGIGAGYLTAVEAVDGVIAGDAAVGVVGDAVGVVGGGAILVDSGLGLAIDPLTGLSALVPTGLGGLIVG